MTYIKAAIILANLLVLSITLYWTTSSWLYLTPQKPFSKRTCTIITSQIPRYHFLYRNEFQVTLHKLSSDPLPKLPTIAFRYGSGIYNQTLKQASTFRERFRETHNYSCWIAHPGDVIPWEYQISLTLPDTTPSARHKDMALTSTLFTAVTLLAILFQLVCLKHKHSRTAAAEQPLQPPMTGLEASRIESVCIQCDETDIDCAICLEESDTPVAKLPCGHLFHTLCVKKWLIRGGRCPLCNWDLSQDHSDDLDDIPIVDGIETTSDISDVVRNSSWRRLIERASRDGGNCIGHDVSASASVAPACEESCDDVSQTLSAGSGETVGLRRRKSSFRAGDGGESSKMER